MKTAQMLRKLRPSALLQLERHSAVRELVKPGSFTYEQLYTTRQGIRAVVCRLSEVERRTMETIIRCFANAPFDESLLMKHAPPGCPGAELRVGLSGLRAAGVILTVRKSWGELLHALPDDALGPWQQELFGAPDWQVPDEKAESTLSALGRIDDDLFALLAYAGKNELTLTQRGVIHKRHVQLLQRELQLSAAADLLRSMGFMYAHADAYDPGTAAVLDAAFAFGLLAAERGALRLQRGRVRAWLRLPRLRRSRMLYAAWLERLWPAEPALQRAAAALEQAPRGVWLALPQLTAWLAGFAGSAPEQLGELIAAQWLKPLAALGWLELGRCTDTNGLLLYLPMEEMPEETGRWYVQPDFELIVPPDVPASVRWELERFAERRSTDQVHIYELSRNSVWFGCELGLTAPEMIRILTDHAMFDVPDNIAQAIGQWAGSYGRAAFAQVTLLRCADAETAEQVKGNPKLLPLLLGQLGECDFIVPQEKLSELRTLLDKAGIAPRKAVETPDAPRQECQFPSVVQEKSTVGQPSAEAAEANVSFPGIFEDWLPSNTGGLIYGTDSLVHLELAPDLPELHEALPDLKEIPAMWWKDYRAYHSSTRKDMIRKAIEWKSLLKLRMEGQDRTVVPKRLHEESGEWSMTALESGTEIRLAGDEWTEMKLVVPGHGEG